jgi:predicted ATPase
LAVVYALSWLLEAFRGDAEAILHDAEILAKIKLPLFSGMAKMYWAWARAQVGDREAGSEELRRRLAEYIEKKALMSAQLFQGLLAELEAESASTTAAAARIEEALALAAQTEQAGTNAFLHRIRGDIVLKSDPANPGRAEDAYGAAIAIAREQGARSFGLQAAVRLAKLYQAEGRPAEAHAVLAPALEGFAPTPDPRSPRRWRCSRRWRRTSGSARLSKSGRLAPRCTSTTHARCSGQRGGVPRRRERPSSAPTSSPRRRPVVPNIGA